MVELNETVIATARLTKVFRDFWMRDKVTAVSDVDLQILPREVFGLLGPNGSGKSTTIKMVLGLLWPTRGRIAVFGKRPTDVGIKARIGFLPEESYLYPFLDARETLDFYGRLYHLPRRERTRRTDMLLEMVGLKSVAYRRIGEYSKGMQRRIGLAQALINDPDLLILDEPTSGLDPLGTAQIKEIIQRLAKRGKTVVLSSHLLADVEDVCDRVCILYGGKKLAEGPLAKLLARHGQTQVTIEDLDESTLVKLHELMDRSGKTVREVAPSRDRLESLFLRIVKEAQEQKLTTGGAVAGGKLAEFLQGVEAPPAEHRGREVIESLVTGEPEQVERAPEPAEQPVEAEPAAREVLEELVAPSEPEPSETESTETVQADGSQREQAPKRPDVDRSLIEGLLGDASDDADEKEPPRT